MNYRTSWNSLLVNSLHRTNSLHRFILHRRANSLHRANPYIARIGLFLTPANSLHHSEFLTCHDIARLSYIDATSFFGVPDTEYCQLGLQH